MKTLTGWMKAGNQNTDMGLVICAYCDELIDTLPTDGVKIIHSRCGRDECVDRCPED